jgi:hypothetical protein
MMLVHHNAGLKIFPLTEVLVFARLAQHVVLRVDEGCMVHVAFDLPNDIADAVPWDDIPRYMIEHLALEGYQEGWLSEE